MRRMSVRRHLVRLLAITLLVFTVGGCVDENGSLVVDLEVDDDIVVTNDTYRELVVLERLEDGSEREVGRVRPRRSARYPDYVDGYVIRTEDGQVVRTVGEEIPYLITDEDLP